MQVGPDTPVRHEHDGVVALFRSPHPLAPLGWGVLAVGLLGVLLAAGLAPVIATFVAGLVAFYAYFVRMVSSLDHAELRVRAGQVRVTGVGWRRNGTWDAPVEGLVCHVEDGSLLLQSGARRLRLYAPGWYRSDLMRLVEHIEAAPPATAAPTPQGLEALRQRS